jgi:hypothetical protein
MTSERFWVIGGDYSCMGFKSLRDSNGATLSGPFDDRQQAQSEWKRLSREHSSRAATRFSIAVEQITLPD